MSRGTESDPEVVKPRLLFFYAASDGEPHRTEGYLAQVLERRRNHESFVVRRIETTERPDLAERYAIRNTPTLVVLNKRQIQARLELPRSAVEIHGLLSPWLR